MDKLTYKLCLQKEVYHNQSFSGLYAAYYKFYCRYFNASTNAVYLFRKMQYLNSKCGMYYKIQVILLQMKLARRYGILVSPEVSIGPGLRFVHPTSIVIGKHVIAGENLSLYQNTTLGGAHIGDVQKGNQPKLGNNVTVFANSAILGKLIVEDNITIGANSVLLQNATNFRGSGIYVGSPAKRIDKTTL